MQSLISLTDLSAEELSALVRRAVEFGGREQTDPVLRGRAVGIYFTKTSTRTRTSFWRAASRLGADVITYGPDDLQLNTGESREDTARVLSQFLDALVVRTNGDISEMRELDSSDMAVVNALSLDEHPTQAIADLATLTEQFGNLSGRHLLYVGEGNSTAAALAFCAALTPGLRLTLLCPSGYGVPDEILDRASRISGKKALIDCRERLDDVAGPADAIYTSRWQTMGVPKADPNWLWSFHGFRVTDDFLERAGGPGSVFLHDLPAIRGQEVTDSVLDGKHSLAWRQAYHKMTAAMAVLERCVLSDTSQ